jgi:ArsR family transcriptional regulator, arsenate/arsenite/antimonite-responsive transcriptional repressor / arsenate reductase (thioredoxin)
MAALTTRQRSEVHAALGDEHRLAIVDLLLISDRTPSEIGSRLGIGSNLLAHHLDTLEAANVVERSVSSGDKRRRYVRLKRETVAQLVVDTGFTAQHVLFVCTHNSARSQLAAALWNETSEAAASSAGTHPVERVHPQAVATARRHGLDLSHARPQSIEDVSTSPDLVVTVCDRAYEELPRLDAPVLHWSIVDPGATGTRAAFEAAFTAIRERVSALAPLVVPR